MLEFAIPSKGRLQEDSLAFLNRIGGRLSKDQNQRSYRVSLDGIAGLSLWMLSSDEIARRLHAGDLHAGLIGEDLLREHGDTDRDIELLARPGFGFADLVIAVPASWIDVQSPADLRDVFAGIRKTHHRPGIVATKYVRQTLDHFRRWGIDDFRIVRSPGATEAAPASGSADVIVDITTTGETLKANHLRPLMAWPLLRSEVNIAASLQARWTPEALAALARILDRQQAVTARMRFLRFSAPADPSAIARRLADAYQAELTHVVAKGEASVYVHERFARDAAADLQALTGKPVSIFAPEALFDTPTGALTRLKQRLDARPPAH